MSEIVRSVVSRFRGFVIERRYAPRVRVRLQFSISIQGANSQRQLQFNGNTLDISANGVGLLLQSIRIDTYYLIKDGRPLSLVLELPSGPVRMVVTPVRYEKLGDSESKGAHLIGATITSMSETDRQRYLAFILRRLGTKTATI